MSLSIVKKKVNIYSKLYGDGFRYFHHLVATHIHIHTRIVQPSSATVTQTQPSAIKLKLGQNPMSPVVMPGDISPLSTFGLSNDDVV